MANLADSNPLSKAGPTPPGTHSSRSPGSLALQRQEHRPPTSTVPSRTKACGPWPQSRRSACSETAMDQRQLGLASETRRTRGSGLRCLHRRPSGQRAMERLTSAGPRPHTGTAGTAPGSCEPKPLSLQISLLGNLGVESQMLEFSLFFYIGFI